MHWVAAMRMPFEARVNKQLNILHQIVANEYKNRCRSHKTIGVENDFTQNWLLFRVLRYGGKKKRPYVIKAKCLHQIPALYFLSHFLIGLNLFHFQTIIGAVLLQGIELALRLMADTVCSLGLYKSDLLPLRSRNRWVGIRLPAWSATVQETDSGSCSLAGCCLTFSSSWTWRLQGKRESVFRWRMRCNATNIRSNDIPQCKKSAGESITVQSTAMAAVRGDLRHCSHNSHFSIS